METRKNPNNQSNLEKEKWTWSNQVPLLQTLYKATVTKRVGSCTKLDIYLNGTG